MQFHGMTNRRRVDHSLRVKRRGGAKEKGDLCPPPAALHPPSQLVRQLILGSGPTRSPPQPSSILRTHSRVNISDHVEVVVVDVDDFHHFFIQKCVGYRPAYDHAFLEINGALVVGVV